LSLSSLKYLRDQSTSERADCKTNFSFSPSFSVGLAGDTE
jgi:hypothetical protein